MNAMPYGADQEEGWDEAEEPVMVPGRPRRRLWGPATAVLLALLVGAICFYAGVRVEKGQMSSTSSSAASTLASRFAAARGGASATAGTSAATGASTGSRSAGFGRFGGGGGNGTFGTVSTVDGHTLYITDTTGNTVQVNLSSATTLSKSETVSAASIHPGDTVVVSGLKGSNGTISASSVNDSGARGSAFGGGGAGAGSGGAGAGGSGGGNSALNSLFGSG